MTESESANKSGSGSGSGSESGSESESGSGVRAVNRKGKLFSVVGCAWHEYWVTWNYRKIGIKRKPGAGFRKNGESGVIFDKNNLAEMDAAVIFALP